MDGERRVRAVRGATTVDVDTVEQIHERVAELMERLMKANGLSEVDLISIIFTATADVTATFPATAARECGFGAVPLLCASEIPVPNSKPRCIRVLMHVESDRPRAEVSHVYLHDAQGLRDDLPG